MIRTPRWWALLILPKGQRWGPETRRPRTVLHCTKAVDGFIKAEARENKEDGCVGGVGGAAAVEALKCINHPSRISTAGTTKRVYATLISLWCSARSTRYRSSQGCDSLTCLICVLFSLGSADCQQTHRWFGMNESETFFFLLVVSSHKDGLCFIVHLIGTFSEIWFE